MYAAQVASDQEWCGFRSHSHVVNRAATYLPITDPSLEDQTWISNIHSQQANKACMSVCVWCVTEKENFVSTMLLAALDFFIMVLVEMLCQTPTELPSITLLVSPNWNQHIVCLPLQSSVVIASKSARRAEIAF